MDEIARYTLVLGTLGYQRTRMHPEWDVRQRHCWEGDVASSSAVSVEQLSTDQTDPCTMTGGSAAMRDLRTQLHAMHEAVTRFLGDDDARRAYWTQVWERGAVFAMRRVNRNRMQFYGFRLMAVTSAIAVPSLVGLNLSGSGGATVRWLTFGLSLAAALATAVLTLFRDADRWLMYRKLSNDLMTTGWTLVNSSADDPAKDWTAFVEATEAAITAYNAEYQTTVIAAAMQKSSSRPGVPVPSGPGTVQSAAAAPSSSPPSRSP